MNDRVRLAFPLALITAGMAAMAFSAAEGATRIDCPNHMLYRFHYSDGKLAAGTEANWGVKIRRGEGERLVGLPKLYVRQGELVCEYELPNGAFALVSRPGPDGAACIAGADDSLSVAYFACE
jgi:hypothetical protein